MKRIILLILFFTGYMLSQNPIDYSGLASGDSTKLIQFAELNGYPTPKRILEFADTLGLSDTQIEYIKTNYANMLIRTRTTEKRIISSENKFSNDYRMEFVNEKLIRRTSEEIGRLRGLLRSIYLITYLKIKNILTKKQVELYFQIK